MDQKVLTSQIAKTPKQFVKSKMPTAQLKRVLFSGITYFKIVWHGDIICSEMTAQRAWKMAQFYIKAREARSHQH